MWSWLEALLPTNIFSAQSLSAIPTIKADAWIRVEVFGSYPNPRLQKSRVCRVLVPSVEVCESCLSE